MLRTESKRPSISPPASPGRLELSATMMKTLSTFSRAGDPNNQSLGVTWPTWPNKLVFDASPTTQAIRVE